MLQLRPAERHDAPALAHLLAQLGYPTDADAVLRRLESLLPREDGAVVVAEAEGRVVGLGTLHLLPVPHEDAPRARITALVVAESARGQGIGQALVRRLEQLARELGAPKMMVTTANHRERTHGFYERLGYQWTGRRYVRSLVPDA